MIRIGQLITYQGNSYTVGNGSDEMPLEQAIELHKKGEVEIWRKPFLRIYDEVFVASDATKQAIRALAADMARKRGFPIIVENKAKSRKDYVYPVLEKYLQNNPLVCETLSKLNRLTNHKTNS